jgi:hypothetical protein
MHTPTILIALISLRDLEHRQVRLHYGDALGRYTLGLPQWLLTNRAILETGLKQFRVHMFVSWSVQNRILYNGKGPCKSKRLASDRHLQRYQVPHRHESHVLQHAQFHLPSLLDGTFDETARGQNEPRDDGAGSTGVRVP